MRIANLHVGSSVAVVADQDASQDDLNSVAAPFGQLTADDAEPQTVRHGGGKVHPTAVSGR